MDTAVVVEEGARQHADEDAEDLQGQVYGILRRAKLPKDNLKNEQIKTLRELRALEDEVILPADKGNATVVMTKEDCNAKLKGMLDTSTYKHLKKDPIAAQAVHQHAHWRGCTGNPTQTGTGQHTDKQDRTRFQQGC